MDMGECVLVVKNADSRASLLKSWPSLPLLIGKMAALLTNLHLSFPI